MTNPPPEEMEDVTSSIWFKLLLIVSIISFFGALGGKTASYVTDYHDKLEATYCEGLAHGYGLGLSQFYGKPPPGWVQENIEGCLEAGLYDERPPTILRELQPTG